MSLRLVFRREAGSDLRNAFEWYEVQRKGLGEEFLGEIERALSRVLEQPTLYQRIHGDARRALPRRFPYAVYYLIESDRIVVLAVTHQARHPDTWQERLR